MSYIVDSRTTASLTVGTSEVLSTIEIPSNMELEFEFISAASNALGGVCQIRITTSRETINIFGADIFYQPNLLFIGQGIVVIDIINPHASASILHASLCAKLSPSQKKMGSRPRE